MKANEAPERIYMTPCFGEPDNVLLASFSKSHLNFHRDIEYTRTDAFIEKAERYIRSVADGLNRDDDVEAFISGFREYMKGE